MQSLLPAYFGFVSFFVLSTLKKRVPAMSPLRRQILTRIWSPLACFAEFHRAVRIVHRLAVDFHDDVAFLQAGVGGIGILGHIRDNRALHAVGNLQFLPHIMIQIGHGHAVERVGVGMCRNQNCFGRRNCRRLIRAMAASVTLKFFCTPSRINFTVAGLPGSHCETASCNPCASETSAPLNAMITSPDLMPAFSAGVPATHRRRARRFGSGKLNCCCKAGRDVLRQDAQIAARHFAAA